MEVASAYLPVTANWRSFYTTNEAKVAEKSNESAKKLVKCAQEIYNTMSADGYVKNFLNIYFFLVVLLIRGYGLPIGQKQIKLRTLNHNGIIVFLRVNLQLRTCQTKKLPHLI